MTPLYSLVEDFIISNVLIYFVVISVYELMFIIIVVMISKTLKVLENTHCVFTQARELVMQCEISDDYLSRSVFFKLLRIYIFKPLQIQEIIIN